MTDPTVTPDPDRDGVILHLPEITYLDTQTWAVDVGLTAEGLVALRTLLAAAASAVSLPPADQTAPSRRAGLRDEIAAAVVRLHESGGLFALDAGEDGRIADAVLPVLYREWPWLRAEAEDAAPADQTARRKTAEAVLAAVETALCDELVPSARAEALAGIAAVLPATTDQTSALAATLREVLDTFSPMHDVYGGPVSYYDGSADIEPKQYERWRAVLDGALRRMADETPAAETEADGAQRLCGKSRGVSGLYYQPCARAAGHKEAYCKSADGEHLFLAASPMDPVHILGIEAAEQPAAECGECGHPKTAHREGDDPVTPGQCADCPDDEDRHDYRAAAGARQDGDAS